MLKATAMKQRVLFIMLFFAGCHLAAAQLNPEPLLIPMRDGENLSAHLYRPNQQDSFPVILIQTPYNKNAFQLGLPLGVGQNIAASDYAFVVMDWRCFYASLPACTANPKHGEDGYDAVEWIAGQPWCNGKVGTWGPSALGNVQFQTAREQPPHLVCAVPMVASPQTHYQQYYPGGAARPEYLETLGILFGNTFGPVINNPHYNLFWQIAESSTMYPGEIVTPMLLIGGWFDLNTRDNLLLFDTLRSLSPAGEKHRLLMGPWTHGGTGPSFIGSVQQGELSFPEAAGWQNVIANQFFAWHLLGDNNGWEASPFVQYFQMGDNEWLSGDVFPPENLETQTYYLLEDQSLHPVLPFAGEVQLNYNYDPTDPSPTIGGKTLNAGLLQGPYDQTGEVESRSDILVFTTAVLAEDLVVKGTPVAHIFVASSRKDTDFALRLTDVYPDGRSILLGETIQRMRFRDGYTTGDTAFMEPGEVYPVTLTFDPLAQTFKAGHRVRLDISSSNYPRYNRDMNTGGEMYPNGNLDTLVNPLVAANAIFMQNNYPSRLELPVVPEAVASQEPVWAGAVRLFPNPAGEQVFLENLPAPATLWLANASGKKLRHFTMTTNQATLGHSGLAPGAYFLTIEDANGQKVTRKIIFGL
ncbi:MAG: CocE/NonD family hydrolase [Saprospiraceae bacterium]|nr:MAG: CocE/NonD family hydrolase [Saprospiraceae bacterium]